MALGDILIRIKADNSEYVNKMREAKNETDKTFSSLDKGMVAVGSTISGLSLAAATASAAMVGSVTMVASSYEDAFVGVRKVLEGTDAEFDALSKGIRNMAKEIPMSVEEIASLAEAAGRLGIPREKILDFTRTVADLGVTTNMGSEEASEAIARFANIMNMSLDDVDKFGSTLVHLGNNLATSEKDIMNMALRMAGIGRESKMAESDVLAFAGAISATGIRAEAGGSSFTRVMKTIISAVHNGGEELEKFGKVSGMSGKEFQKAFKEDSAQAVLSFVKGLSKLSSEGANTAAILDELGISGVYNQDLMIRLAGASDILEESLSMGSQAWEDNTALVEEANQRYETFSSYVKIIKNRLKDFLITIGTPMLKVWKRWIDALEPVMQKIEGLADKFESLDDKTQDMIATALMLVPAFFGVGAILGAVVIAFGKVTMAVKTAGKHLGLTPKHFSKILSYGKRFARFGGIFGLIIGYIIDLIPAIKKVHDSFKPLQDAVSSFGDTFKKVFGGIFGDIKDEFVKGFKMLDKVMDEVENLFKKPVGNGSEIVEVYGTLFTNIVKIAEKGLNVIKVLFDASFPAIKATVNNSFQGILTTVKVVTNLIVGVVNSFAQILNGDFSGAMKTLQNTTKAILGAIRDYFVNTFSNISNAVSSILDLIGGLFSSAWDGFYSIFEKGLTKVWRGTDEGLESILRTAKSFHDSVSTVFSALWSFIETVFIGGFGILTDLVNGDFKSIGDKMSSIWETTSTFIGEKWEDIKTSFSEGFSNIGTKLSEWWESSKNDWSEGLAKWEESITTWFTEMPGKLESLLLGWEDALTNYIDEQMRINLEWLDNMGSDIKNFFTEMPGKISEELSTWFESFSTGLSDIGEGIKSKISDWKDNINGWFKKQDGDNVKFLEQWDGSIVGYLLSMVATWNVGTDSWREALREWFKGIPKKMGTWLKDWSETIKGWFRKVPDEPEIIDSGRKIVDKVQKGTDEKKGDFSRKLGKLIVDVAILAFQAAALTAFAVGRDIIGRIWDGIKDKFGSLNWGSIGENVVKGIVKGLTGWSATSSIVTAATNVAKKAYNAAKNWLDIRSPSRKFTEIGKWSGEGMARGLNKSTSSVIKAAKAQAEAARKAADNSIQNLKTKYEVAKIDPSKYIANLKKIQTQYKLTSAQSRTVTKEIYRANQAIAKQAQALKGSITKINTGVKKVNSTLLSDVRKINDKLKKDIAKAKADFKKTVEGATDRIYSQIGLFGKVDTKKAVGADLLANLQAQNKHFEEWSKNIAKIGKKGAPKAFLEEIREMGISYSGEIEALAGMSSKQFDAYIKAWKKKHSLAKAEAKIQTENEKAQLAKEIESLTKSAVKEIAKAKTKWTSEIRKLGTEVSKLGSFKNSGKVLGVDTAKGLINGLNSMKGGVAAEAAKLAKTITKTIKSTLKIKSPSRVMLELGKFTGEGLVVGLERMVSEVSKSSDKLSEAMMTDAPNLKLSYATPEGIERNLSSAVNGTVEIRNTDDGIVEELRSMRRDIAAMKVVMNDREVGNIVTPIVTENQERDAGQVKRFRRG